MAKQAKDTFVGTLPDGADHFVAKGAVYPDAHAVVKQWPGLFTKLEEDNEPPPKSAPAKAEAPQEPVKPAPARAAGKAKA